MNNIDPISGADLGCPNCAKLNALVNAFRARIRELENELANRDDEMAAVESRMERAKAEGRALQRKLNGQGHDASFSEYSRARTLQSLQRALDSNDEVGIARSLEMLKRGW